MCAHGKKVRSLTVPMPIKSKTRRLFLFSHWLKSCVILNRKEKTIAKRIFGEFSELITRKGATVKRLTLLHKSIHANRALIRKSRILLI